MSIYRSEGFTFQKLQKLQQEIEDPLVSTF